MLATKVPVTEPTIPDDSLGSFLAVLIVAADLLGGHTASEGHSEVEG